MLRRDFLLSTATAAAQLATISTRAVARATSSVRSRARPLKASWPTDTAWQSLRREVGNRLHRLVPLSKCSDSACVALRANPFYLGDQPESTQIGGWIGAWESSPSEYALEALNAADVAAAINFARKRNIRLVVKGGGHSYQGTSNAPDSLLIWTRRMNQVVLHDSFVPHGVRDVLPQPAVSMGSGAMWIDAYHAVTTKAGRYVQGGGCTTVGVAGLVQSGGFGSFSKGFGLAAASLLEVEIVTADGHIRTVNAVRDPDLFWALKGGGGGSWGVITRLTLRTHDLPEFFGAARGTIRAKTDAAYRRLIIAFLDFYEQNLLNPHWGEQVKLRPDNSLEIAMNCQGLGKDQPSAIWSSFFELLTADRDWQVTSELRAGSSPARHWWDVAYRKSRGNSSMISDPRPEAPSYHAWWSGDGAQASAFLYAYDSAWLPASLLRPDQRVRLADALFNASRFQEVEIHFNKGLAGAPAQDREAAANTAMNPQVLSAFALAIIADGGPPGGPDKIAAAESGRKVSHAMRELLRVAPAAGSYVSESNYFEPSWQRAHWGPNYARLRRIKAQYDPDELFYVHHGVGSERWSADGFTRLG